MLLRVILHTYTKPPKILLDDVIDLKSRGLDQIRREALRHIDKQRDSWANGFSLLKNKPW